MAEFEKKHIDDLDEYEPDIVELDGEPFEIIDTLEYNGENYVALVSYVEDMDSEPDETEFIILKEVEEEDGEFYLATLDDDDLYSEIGDKFLEHFNELFEEDEE